MDKKSAPRIYLPIISLALYDSPSGLHSVLNGSCQANEGSIEALPHGLTLITLKYCLVEPLSVVDTIIRCRKNGGFHREKLAKVVFPRIWRYTLRHGERLIYVIDARGAEEAFLFFDSHASKDNPAWQQEFPVEDE